MLVHHTDHCGGASVVKAIFVHITHDTQARSHTSVFVFSCILFYTHPVISEELNMCWIMKSLLQTSRSITRLKVLNYICSHYWSWAFPHIHQNFETNKEKRKRQERRRQEHEVSILCHHLLLLWVRRRLLDLCLVLPLKPWSMHRLWSHGAESRGGHGCEAGSELGMCSEVSSFKGAEIKAETRNLPERAHLHRGGTPPPPQINTQRRFRYNYVLLLGLYRD